ncbi:MAG: glyoxalase superfamily protein [Bacteroidota bacterium]|nr:glyoxalase superfamily protein [Bacteroidota bacterium]
MPFLSLACRMVTPVFAISDYSLAIDYYVGWLGFLIDWEEPLAVCNRHYFQVSRSNVILHLTDDAAECRPGSKAIAEVTGLLSYHHQLQSKDAAFELPPLHKTSWSDKVVQLEVVDPFGNHLVLAEVAL